MTINTRNIYDALICNSISVNNFGNYILSNYFKEQKKFEFKLNINYTMYNNINFSLDYVFDNIIYSIYICEWYDEINLFPQLEAYILDSQNNYFEHFPKGFLFVTKKNLEDKVKEIINELNASQIKIIFIEDIIDKIGG